MKAAVWTGKDKIEVRELPIPEIGVEEALIRVCAAGVCATDYHIISGQLAIGRPPNVQGHEICGRIEKINSSRKDLSVGQRCVIATSIGCGKCAYCREGKQYLCKDSSEIGFYPHNGGYAEYVKLPVSCIVPIPDEVSDLAGSILESVVCPAESLMRVGIPFGSTVLVTGAGAAALGYIAVAKALGAVKIISLVRREEKARLVLRFGADEAVDSSKVGNVEDEILSRTGGEGADVVIETTGAPAIISACPFYCKKGGRIVQYGIPADGDTVTVPVKRLVTGEIAVYGTVGNTKAWYPLIEMIKSGRLNVEKMVTHTFRIEEIDRAFDLYRNHDKSLIKAVILFDGEQGK